MAEALSASSGSPGLAALVDAAAILAFEQQAHAAAVLGHHTFQLDATAGTFTADRSDGPALDCRAALVGSAAPGPGTWLWGWRNVNGFADVFVQDAGAVREAGERLGVPELTTAEIPLDEDLPLRLTLAAQGLLGARAHYPAPAGTGTTAWLLLDHPDLALPAPTVLGVLEAVRAALLGVEVADHRAALTAWAERRGVALTAAPDVEDVPAGSAAVRLTMADGAAVVVLDDRGRIISMRSVLTPEAAAAAGGKAPEPAAATAGSRRPRFLGRLLGRG